MTLKTKCCLALLCAAVCFSSALAFADGLSMGSILPDYGIVSVGANASLTVNSGPITGRVLIGYDSNATSAGGGNGQITDGLYISPPRTGDDLQNLQFAPTVTILPATVGAQAFLDAGNLSSAAAALTPTQTFGAINGSQTINGNGGLNVISVASLHNPVLTIVGTANDTFVFNVPGLFATNQVITLSGILPSQILWNMTGTGTVFQTSGGNKVYGTFLSTNGGDFQFSAINLTGELINTGGHIQFVSNSKMTADPFVPPQAVPEPGTLAMMGTGVLGLAGILRRKFRS